MPEDKPGEMPTNDTPASEMPAATTTDVSAELEALRAALKKANSEAASHRHKVAKFEEAEKKRQEAEMSEMDRLQAQLQTVQAERDALRIDGLKRRIAAEVGLPDALALRLNGDDEATLKADAEALALTLPKQAPTPPVIAATNPAGNGKAPKETDAQRKARVYGNTANRNLYDRTWQEQHGGGVHFRED